MHKNIAIAFLLSASLSATAEIPLYQAIEFGENEPTAINDRGQVVGYSGKPEAYLFRSGALRYLGTLGGQTSGAFDINELGHVTGSADVASSRVGHLFLYKGGVMMDLRANASGAAINIHDEITGSVFRTELQGSHAFLYSHGVFTDLGTLGRAESWGIDINASGHVIGYSSTDGPVTSHHGFLYTPETGMMDLDALRRGDPGCRDYGFRDDRRSGPDC